MPFLAFIGGTFTVWPERLVLIHLSFHCSCCRTSSPHLRSTVLFLFGSGSSSIYPQVISYSSVPVLVLLLSVRQDPLVWVSLPSRWMDALLVCYVFGWFSSALFHQSVSLWYESPSYQTRFCRSSSQLSSLAACYTRHQRTQGFPSSSRLPITDDLILVIWKSWNLQLVCFGRDARWSILGCAVRGIQSLLWQVSPPWFIWTCRISQWTPAQIPHASPSLSRPQRQIRSARAAPFILALASIPYALFMCCWLTWLSVVMGRPSVSLSKGATSLAYSTLQLAVANYGACRNFW